MKDFIAIKVQYTNPESSSVKITFKMEIKCDFNNLHYSNVVHYSCSVEEASIAQPVYKNIPVEVKVPQATASFWLTLKKRGILLQTIGTKETATNHTTNTFPFAQTSSTKPQMTTKKLRIKRSVRNKQDCQKSQ
jgi:hypothetical protein